MTQINLLPWREARRKHQQQHFFALLAVAALAAVGMVIGAHQVVQSQIDAQQARNRFLQTSIAQLDREIKEIRDLEKTKTQLLSHMEVIGQLQTNRPQVVHVLNALVDTLPDGIYLGRFERRDNGIRVTGTAQSNGHISEYLRNLDGSDWFNEPDLGIIQTRRQGPARTSSFELKVAESTPQPASAKQAVRTAAR